MSYPAYHNEKMMEGSNKPDELLSQVQEQLKKLDKESIELRCAVDELKMRLQDVLEHVPECSSGGEVPEQELVPLAAQIRSIRYSTGSTYDTVTRILKTMRL